MSKKIDRLKKKMSEVSSLREEIVKETGKEICRSCGSVMTCRGLTFSVGDSLHMWWCPDCSNEQSGIAPEGFEEPREYSKRTIRDRFKPRSKPRNQRDES